MDKDPDPQHWCKQNYIQPWAESEPTSSWSKATNIEIPVSSSTLWDNRALNPRDILR